MLLTVYRFDHASPAPGGPSLSEHPLQSVFRFVCVPSCLE